MEYTKQFSKENVFVESLPEINSAISWKYLVLIFFIIDWYKNKEFYFNSSHILSLEKCCIVKYNLLINVPNLKKFLWRNG